MTTAMRLTASALMLGGAALMMSASDAQAQPFCTDDQRVMGGCSVSIGDFPWMVSLGQAFAPNRHDAHFCGGTVIADTWVLTAAHCVDTMPVRNPEGVEVYSGTASLDGGGAAHDIRTVYIHPGYQGVGRHDIALLEMARPMGIAPVPLSQAGGAAEAVGGQSVITGWGLTPPPHIAVGRGQLSPSERASDQAPSQWGISRVLLGAAVPIVDLPLCGRGQENSIVCAGFQEARADACRGDSGGPLHGIGPNGYVQIGLVSGGNYCHQDGDHYGIYTRVSFYADWINQVMAGQGEVVDGGYGQDGTSSTARPDPSLPPTFGSVSLSAGFQPDPYRFSLQAGGRLNAANLSPACNGFIAAAPDYQLHYSGSGSPLQLTTIGQPDTTLLVNGPDGSWYCDDDGAGELQPLVSWNNPMQGRYDIWVGTYGSPAQVGFPTTELIIRGGPGGSDSGENK